MSVSLQVMYPAKAETTFDHNYYLSTHMDLLDKHMGAHIASTVVTKGLAGADDAPAGYHVIATILFKDQAAFGAAMAAAAPVVADISEFYSGTPEMLVGEVVG
ncbi:EthD family reductase [Roseobacter sp.]|uniref:EthD family reductase n=1 Tax=Roseobacter sp. TaxID=1907202 RepID=UPI00385CFB45